MGDVILTDEQKRILKENNFAKYKLFVGEYSKFIVMNETCKSKKDRQKWIDDYFKSVQEAINGYYLEQAFGLINNDIQISRKEFENDIYSPLAGARNLMVYNDGRPLSANEKQILDIIEPVFQKLKELFVKVDNNE